MLRCPPSSINLTSADVSEFENRFVARHTARLSAAQRRHGRVNRGPVRKTHRSITPAEHNPMHGRLHSVEKHAAIVITSDTRCEHLPTASNLNDLSMSPRSQGQHEQHLASGPLASRSTFVGDARAARSSSEHQSTAEDRTLPVDGRPSVKATEMLMSARQTYEHSNRDPAARSALNTPTSEPSGEPRSEGHGLRHHNRLRVDRMRHRHSRSLDDHFALLGNQRHLRPLREASEEDLPPLNKDQQASEHSTHPLRNPALDPEASVFMPRVRLASSRVSSSQPGCHSIGAHTTICAPEILLPQRHEMTGNDQDLSLHLDPDGVATTSVNRRRSRTDAALAESWHHSLQHLSPVLDRYPILKPPSQASIRRDSITSETIRVPAPACLSSSSPNGQTYAPNPDKLRPIVEVPLQSTSFPVSHSWQPYNNRMESLGDNHTELSSHVEQRRVSTVSAASGISGISECSDLFETTVRGSSRPLDAVEAFIRRRASPLDELSSQLGRMQVSLSGMGSARSTEGSWHQHQSKCVSLLDDHIFDSGTASSSPLPALTQGAGSHIEPESPSRRTMSGAGAFESHPATGCQAQSTVDRTILAKSPGTPSPSSTSTRSRVFRATPKVTVFNDNVSPSAQPQTPADLRSRRMNIHILPSEHEGSYQQTTTSPVRIPPRTTSLPLRTSPNRDSPNRQRRVDLAHRSPGPGQHDRGPRERTRPTHRRRRIRNENEEDEMGILSSAEEERRVWGGRGGQGSLDTTPPAAGRYERFAFGG